MKPQKIKLAGQQKLMIDWEDGTSSELPLPELRRFCPCATCMEERDSQSENYFAIYTKDQQTIVGIQPVGNYAISLIWKDGHSTGIYDYTLLKNLSVKFSGKNATP